MNPDNFGKNVTAFREFIGISQAELAKRAGLTAAAICQLEKGDREPMLKTIVKIMKAFNVKFERLVK